jgi:hypothetical protein
MHSVARIFVAVAFAMAAASAAPAFAQGVPATPHMLIKYQPASGGYCFAILPMDAGSTALSRLPESRCKTQTPWSDRGTIRRR